MSELKHLPHGHLLHVLSPQNQRLVGSYLALLLPHSFPQTAFPEACPPSRP